MFSSHHLLDIVNVEEGIGGTTEDEADLALVLVPAPHVEKGVVLHVVSPLRVGVSVRVTVE